MRSACQANQSAREDWESSPLPGLEYIDSDPPWGAPPALLPVPEEDEAEADPFDLHESLEVHSCLYLEETQALLSMDADYALYVSP